MFTGPTVCHKRESLLCPGLYNCCVSSVCSQLISQPPKGFAFSVSAAVYRLYIWLGCCSQALGELLLAAFEKLCGMVLF